MSFPLRNPTHIFTIFALIIVCWAFSWPATKIGLEYMPPLWFAAYRLVFGAIFLFLFLIPTRRLVKPHWRDIPMLLVMGILQIGTFMILITVGLSTVDAGRAAIITYTTPIWVLPISAVFFGERLNRGKLIGLCCGIAGVVLLFSPWNFDWSNHTAIMGNGLLIIAAWCWSAALLYARHGRWYNTPVNLIPWQLVVGAVEAVLVAFILQPDPVIRWVAPLWIVLVYNGLFATAIGYWGMITVSKELPAMATALGLLAVPVLAVIFCAAMLGEPLTYGILTAVAFIIVGLTYVALGARQTTS